ncbi:MAG: restriction endonuclease [Acidimicrobiales bacterium]|jgi:ABC-type nickel/cobalt efflux system permease component RcnA
MRLIPWWLRLGVVAGVGLLIWQSDTRTQVAAIVFVAIVGLAMIVRRVRRPRIRDWRDAETAAARWLRKAGCRRVSLTGGSADGGIDVITAEWAVQVKHTTKRVGRPAVQQLVGAALTLNRFPALFSTSGFSAPACAYASDHDVALFELDLDGRAHGINRPARRVGKRTRRLLPGR